MSNASTEQAANTPSSVLQQLFNTALRAQQYAAAVASTAANLIESLMGKGVLVTLTAGDWALTPNASQGSAEVAAYPYYYEITVQGLTANDRADVSILPASMSAAVSSGVWYMTETLANKIRLRAKTQPTVDLSAEYWIIHGKE